MNILLFPANPRGSITKPHEPHGACQSLVSPTKTYLLCSLSSMNGKCTYVLHGGKHCAVTRCGHA
jgi:hypothetical protein